MARLSQRSFSGWPAWPLTHCQLTSWGSTAAKRRFQRSTFLTGCLLAVLQPRLIQPEIQCCLKALTTYWESVTMVTVQGRRSASRPTMAPMSSMRLLVVRR